MPSPEAAVSATGAMMPAGGTRILLGVKPKFGAPAVAAFLGAVSPVMHDFWNVQEPSQRMAEMVNFTKNMALLGSALALMSIEEPWPASVPLAQPEAAGRLRRITRILKEG